MKSPASPSGHSTSSARDGIERETAPAILSAKNRGPAFKHQPHLPYTRTVLGAGPNGETVIFEVDTKNEALADELQRRFEQI